MKIFEVEITTTVVVIGVDEDDACYNANEDIHEIKADSEFYIEVVKEVNKDALPDGWDAGCIPYGGDGNVRIENIK
jgi:hypothetical protein